MQVYEGEGRPKYELPKDPWQKLGVLVGLDVRYYAKGLGIDFRNINPPENMPRVPLPSSDELQGAKVEDLFQSQQYRTGMIFGSFDEVRKSGSEAQERALKMINAGKEYKVQILAAAGNVEQSPSRAIVLREGNETPVSHENSSSDILTCIICRFETELDDTVIKTSTRCVCLRCYGRETGSQLSMPKALRREIIATLDTLEP